MIRLKDIHKKFGENYVLRGVSLDFENGKTHAIVGKSGCGKSVLLKIIVGLLAPERGSVEIDGVDISQISESELYEVRKKFGFLFQSAALFDSLTVAENIALPLTENEEYNFTQKEIEKIVAEKLELVNLSGTENLKPSELSGGMQKRVGLARALVTNPEYLLYDEPTTGLDPVMSDSIDNLISRLNETLGVTSILVTHDMFSVEKVAEFVSMIDGGKIRFSGKTRDFLNSNDEVIYNFIKRTKQAI